MRNRILKLSSNKPISNSNLRDATAQIQNVRLSNYYCILQLIEAQAAKI